MEGKQILFSGRAVEKLCNDSKAAQRRLGPDCAKRLRQRLDDLDAAFSLADFRSLPGQCEELKAERKGQLSLRLQGGLRLIFEPANAPPPLRPDGGLDWERIDSVRILEIEDYHD